MAYLLNFLQSYFNAAAVELDTVLSVKDLDGIDCMLLLVLYQLRSPSYPGIWHLIRHTMTSCLESGLHRKARIWSYSEDERRKRLWWSVYGLERSITITLGRPYSVSERDIDVEVRHKTHLEGK